MPKSIMSLDASAFWREVEMAKNELTRIDSRSVSALKKAQWMYQHTMALQSIIFEGIKGTQAFEVIQLAQRVFSTSILIEQRQVEAIAAFSLKQYGKAAILQAEVIALGYNLIKQQIAQQQAEALQAQIERTNIITKSFRTE